MKIRMLNSCLAATTLLLVSGCGVANENSGRLATLASGEHRTEGYAARNDSRHPVETLSFFGLESTMTVVEMSPGGGGWYTEILAPYLRDDGKLFAASYDINSASSYYRRNGREYVAKLSSQPELYDKIDVTVFAPPGYVDIAPDNSADLVLVFRNVHNWMENGVAERAFEVSHKALKPGGVLGVVQHRGNPDQPQDPMADSGYVTEETVIEMAVAAGFELTARSEINANPKDTKDHPEGVWTLPPSFDLEDKDRAKYAAIGESDRMTLKFTKPQ